MQCCKLEFGKDTSPDASAPLRKGRRMLLIIGSSWTALCSVVGLIVTQWRDLC